MSKTIFISGASRGIGFSIAELFHREGWQVMICARNEEKLAKTKTRLPGLITHPCDIGQKSEVAQLVQSILEQIGTPDVLVNNAGIFLPGQIHAETDEVFTQTMAINLEGTYRLTKHLVPGMIDRGSGTIVNMGSTAGNQAYANGGSYAISKHALLGFSRNLREELRPHRIRVVHLSPGAVLTDSWAEVDLPEDRFIPPEDIAQIVWTACNLSSRTTIEDIIIRPTAGDI